MYGEYIWNLFLGRMCGGWVIVVISIDGGI